MKKLIVIFLICLTGCSIITQDIPDLDTPEPIIKGTKIELKCVECNPQELNQYFRTESNNTRYELIFKKSTNFTATGLLEPMFRGRGVDPYAMVLSFLPNWRMLPCVLTLGIIPGKLGEYEMTMQARLIDKKTMKSIELTPLKSETNRWVSWLFFPFSNSYSKEKQEKIFQEKVTSMYLKEAANILYNPESNSEKWVCEQYGTYMDYNECIKRQLFSQSTISFSDLMASCDNSEMTAEEIYKIKKRVPDLTQKQKCQFLRSLFKSKRTDLSKILYDEIIDFYKDSCNDTESYDFWNNQDYLLSNKNDVINAMGRLPDREYHPEQDIDVMLYDNSGKVYRIFKLYKGLVIE